MAGSQRCTSSFVIAHFVASVFVWFKTRGGRLFEYSDASAATARASKADFGHVIDFPIFGTLCHAWFTFDKSPHAPRYLPINLDRGLVQLPNRKVDCVQRWLLLMPLQVAQIDRDARLGFKQLLDSAVAAARKAGQIPPAGELEMSTCVGCLLCTWCVRDQYVRSAVF